MSEVRRCVTYARQSITRDDADSLSIEFQERECAAYATRQGWVMTGTYSDPDTKGWRRNRPGFDAMLEAIGRGESDTVLVYKLSRFARNLMMQEAVVSEIADAGGTLISVTEPHINTPMIRQILGAVNENYRRDQSDWLRSTFAARARRGMPHGYAPFGYRKEDKHLVPDDATAAIARQVFDWALQGEGSVEITFRLNERGILTQRGRAWQPEAVLDILRNPAYAGHVQHRGEVVARDTHPAIVTDAEYQQVQAIIARRSQHRRKASPSWAEGFVWHACGRRMYLAGWHRNGEDRPRFRCAHAFARSHRGESPCTIRPASTFAAYVERDLPTMLGDLVDRLASPTAILDALRAQQGATERQRATKRTRLERRLADLERQRQRLLDLVLQERIDPALYGERDAALKVELATVRADLDATPPPIDPAAVTAQHQQIAAMSDVVRVVAGHDPAALVPVLTILEARYVIGDGSPRLEVGEAFQPYFAP